MSEPIVFLVDDDPAIRKALPRALAMRGYHVKPYASAKEFLDDYQAHQAGCLVLDLSMPEMDGLELQDHLRKRAPDLPVIFITGHGDIPQSVQALRAGALDFLEKPFRQEALLARIDEAFASQKIKSDQRKDPICSFDRSRNGCVSSADAIRDKANQQRNRKRIGYQPPNRRASPCSYDGKA